MAFRRLFLKIRDEKMNDHLLNRPFTLDEVAKALFRATLESDKSAQRLKDTLGFGAFNVPARLAIARSLSILDMPPNAFGDPSRGIKGDTLFGSGADLGAWVSLIIEHAGRAPKDLAEFQAWVRAHWARGMQQLQTIVEQSCGDASELWRLITEGALSHSADGSIIAIESGFTTSELSATPIVIPVGEVAEEVATGAHVSWALNGVGGSPHAAFMGGVGSGKTRIATMMIRRIRERTNVPIIAFDFKGDLADSRNKLHTAFEADVLSPPQQSIPLDVLAISDRSAIGISMASQRFRDSLSTLKGAGFGAIQKGLLGEAAEQAFKAKMHCEISDVLGELVSIYGDRGKKEDGAVETLRDLSRFRLFDPQMTPAQFFSKSWIIRLTADLSDNIKTAIVTLVTDALELHLNSQDDSGVDESGNRALRNIAFIDEANRILGKKLPGLSGLVRLSRSKGGSVILISQSPDDFMGVDEEFLDQMGLVVAFGSNAGSSSVRRILGPNASLSNLKRGQAWVKMSGDASAKRIIAWK